MPNPSRPAAGSPQRPTRPVRPLDTNDVVLTPGGLRPRSLVHQLAPGQHVSTRGGRMQVIDTATGNIVADLDDTIPVRVNTEAAGSVPSIPDIAWIENSEWQNDTQVPIVYFSTTWVVPPAPASNDGQTVYLFNGMQPDSRKHILQPVLQWGLSEAGGAWVWAIANWYADGQGGPAVYSSLIEVGTGDVLQGVMTCTSMTGDEFNYTSSFVGYPSINLSVTATEELTWAFETLECYGPGGPTVPFTECSDYPNAVYTAMYAIELKTGLITEAGTDAVLNWTALTRFSDCGQQCVIDSNDSPGGEVDLYYHVTPWKQLDNNPACQSIVAGGALLYQLHRDGTIWKYVRPAFSGWQMLDNNPNCRSIVADGAALYQLHQDGSIWQYVGPQAPNWIQLDNNPSGLAIAASGGNLYQLHTTGSIWKYTGVPLSGWQLLDNSPACRAIIADDNELYKITTAGGIWQYVGPTVSDWQQLDSNPATRQIAASGGILYQLHDDGGIWQYVGPPIVGWQQLDNNPACASIVADGAQLFQLHRPGSIWKYLGIPMGNWQQLDTSPDSVEIAASAGLLYQMHSNGEIFQFV